MKSDPIEQALNRLSELRGERNAAAVEELRRALKHKSNLVVAKAAKIAGESRLSDLGVPAAAETIKVLARFHNDEKVRERVKAAVEERGERKLEEAFRESF